MVGRLLAAGAVRSRRIVFACLITLLVSTGSLGLIGLIRWHGQGALKSDTHAVVSQASEQLLRALISRRGTLTFIRDILKRRADLDPQQLQAMGGSATDHTRHLLGIGLAQPEANPQWWHLLQEVTPQVRATLQQAINHRLQLRGAWHVPATFLVMPDGPRPLLIMLEPFQTTTKERRAIIGVFDLKPLVEDFFASRVAPRHPVQLLDGDLLLYRSQDWRPPTDAPAPIIVEQSLFIDATRWLIQMQPGSTRVVQTLSWLNVLLIGLSIVAGLGVTIIVWLLVARTWILERAVTRRTVALRRTSEQLRELATRDDLTGLYNRRFFLDRWGWEYQRAKRYGRSLACLMIDVNGFKQVNDRLGHLAGDVVLKHVANELKTALRQSDILARFGGDEFIVALPETSPEQAAAVAEKLRQVMIQVPDGAAHQLSSVRLSVGVSLTGDPHKGPQDMIQAADQSLYASRQLARTHGKSAHSSAVLR